VTDRDHGDLSEDPRDATIQPWTEGDDPTETGDAQSETSDESLVGEAELAASEASGDTTADLVPDAGHETSKSSREGRYKTLREIGRGGMAVVYEAEDRKLKRLVAVKVINSKLVGSRTALARFRAEAETIAMLEHDHIVRLYDWGEHKTGPFLVMQLISGENLGGRVHRQGRIEPHDAIRLMLPICRALQYAHARGIIHRDIKPGNILVVEEPHGLKALLTDFGLARRDGGGGFTQTGGTLGTPVYMAPEQHDDPRNVDQRSDLWSLAATMYEMVTGRVPRTIYLHAIPQPLQAVLGRALEHEPDQRHASVAEFAEELQSLLSSDADLGGDPASLPKQHDLADLLKRTTQQVDRLHAQARQLIDSRGNYQRAVDLLAQVPEHLRDQPLYKQARDSRDRVGKLDSEIRERVQAVRLAGLRTLVEELLDLQPSRTDLARLLDHLPPEPRITAQSHVSPFTPDQARQAQEAWASQLGLAVVQTNSIGMQLTLIPPGEFQMGSPKDELERQDCEHQHLVRITRPYLLGVFSVTQQEYAAVVDKNPSHFQKQKVGQDTSRFPVESVRWLDAVAFCNALSEREGRTPCYRIQGEEVSLVDGNGYRLPMEAQWEYACRAGTTTPFSFGKACNGREANCDGNHPYGTSTTGPYLERTTTVGSYAANGFGLYDMHGQVWDLCQDWYDESYYRQSPEEDPPGPTVGSFRVLRGGSWNCYAVYVRSAHRDYFRPTHRRSNIGFRVLLSEF